MTPSEAGFPASAHKDERQIQLDTDRSFVLYPVGEPFVNPSLASFVHSTCLQMK